MYFRILKKDLRRKKTMNAILFIFIVIGSMFIASSVNNLISISTALDTYLEKAGVYDYIVMTKPLEEESKEITNFFDNSEYVEKWVEDDSVKLVTDNVTMKDGQEVENSANIMINTCQMKQQKFFDSKNQEINSIQEGTIYLPLYFMTKNELEVGDKITITGDNYKKEFTIKGNVKDVVAGSSMMGILRVLVSEKDYQEIYNQKDFSHIRFYSVNATDMSSFKKEFDEKGFNIIVSFDWELIKTTYIMDMITAGMLIIISAFLIIISLILLRFTILFTIKEEFKEIGVMKAIGIGEYKIRGLYMIKYFGISIVGAFVGLIFSFPFGELFRLQIAKNIVLVSSKNSIGINCICALLIVFIVVLFSFTSTRMIHKVSPISAIRDGNKGERFTKKGFLRLGKMKLPPVVFMAINDILSDIKKYFILLFAFTLGIILLVIPIDTINTLSSNETVTWFSMKKSDLYLVNEKASKKFYTAGREEVYSYLRQMEEKLQDENIPAKVYTEILFKFKVTFQDTSVNTTTFQGNGITADEYIYLNGEGPVEENEVAITTTTAGELGATIGDTIEIEMGNKRREYVVTGIYQSMNNMGEGVRLSEVGESDYKYTMGNFAFQIEYTDNPDNKTIEERREQIEEIFSDSDVYSGKEYINMVVGDISKQLVPVKQFILIVVIGINMLVTVLLIQTFIMKEKGEIGMLRSIGFQTSSLIKWQVLRIGIVLLISTILAGVLSTPVAEITAGQIFKMMGASKIEFQINPLEVYLFYPGLVLCMTLIAATLTSLQIRKIAAKEVNNIE